MTSTGVGPPFFCQDLFNSIRDTSTIATLCGKRNYIQLTSNEKHAALAQWLAHLTCNEKVTRSTRVRGRCFWNIILPEHPGIISTL